MTEQRPKLIIVGAGLVGCLAAQYMHKYGFQVILYEYRNDLRKATKTNGQSINLALSNRGLKALQNAGIDVASLLQITVPMKGRMIHEDGNYITQKMLLYDVKYERCIYSVGRSDLIKLLLTEVEKHSKINFGYKITNIDLKQRKLKILRIADSIEFDEEFDYLIGCDGAYSLVRQIFLKTPLFNYTQTYIDHGYVELKIPSKSSNQKTLLSEYLHIWPRKTFMLIALPNHDKSWTVTLFMPFAEFDRIKDSDQLLDFFIMNFSDVLPLIDKQNLLDAFFVSKPQPLITIKCSRYNNDSRCLILGDAAHAVVPFFGQGMNAGFEDCRILYQALKQFGHENGFEKFSKIRTPDGHAISDLSMLNYLEMRNLVTNRLFLLQKKVNDVLYKCFPNVWVPLYIRVTFSDIPYSQCVIIDKFQKKILIGLLIFFSLLFCGITVFLCTRN